MGTKQLIKSVMQSKGESALTAALDNSNEEAKKQDRKDTTKAKN